MSKHLHWCKNKYECEICNPKLKDYWVKVSFMKSESITIPITAKDNFTAMSRVLKRYSDEEKEVIGVKITHIQDAE